jgi:putative glutamine amidotransferase
MSHGTSSNAALIGITTALEPARWATWVREAALLPHSYLAAVERAGGTPVLLPPTRLAHVTELVRRLDGIILSGGCDIDPALYGAPRHEATSAPRPQRDRFELAVVRAAIEGDVPFLGICRGMQVLNVARGGLLIQHLPELIGHDGHLPTPGRMATHSVQISTTSTVGKLLGTRLDVPTYHHQAVERLGKGLLAVAWADDQVVEAVELQGHRFGLAVQWHPEEGDDLRLFEALVEAAAE